MFKFIKSFFSRRSFAPELKVSLTDSEIVVTHSDETRDVMEWRELNEVSIITTDQGPYVEDVFWVLQVLETACIIPSSASGIDKLIERLQELPNFDNLRVIEAMGSAENNRFLVWSK